MIFSCRNRKEKEGAVAGGEDRLRTFFGVIPAVIGIKKQSWPEVILFLRQIH